ncbi:OmpA family protein [Candidatus Marithrix sp. Canyon 246]|uniref:OmpA family protein n=1 Tax=Candidatus Marithrix sp. Canyon 246 TaxID=1827136 RepID=UPI00084A26D5|nr:OmpA family protein [Candidatus Marithrix sp. Canyon 246]
MFIKNQFILTIICITLAPLAWADNYPTTAAEIVNALSSSPWQRKSYNQDKNIGGFASDIPTVIAAIKNLIEIGGHTDSRGGWNYNKYLSKRRASSVKRFLIRQRINSRQLKVAAYGESKPIATNRTNSGRTKNRRVEFKRLN